MRIEAYECDKCGKLYKSESEYLRCVRRCSDEYELVRKIKCNDTNEDTIEVEYNHKKLSDIVSNNGQLCLSIYSDNEFDGCVELDGDKIEDLIDTLNDFRSAYMVENFIRKLDRSDDSV